MLIKKIGRKICTNSYRIIYPLSFNLFIIIVRTGKEGRYFLLVEDKYHAL